MQRYEELKSRLLALCKSQPEIKAVIIIGSQASEVSKADEYSDLDLIVACSKPDMLLFSDELVANSGKSCIRLLKIQLQEKRNVVFCLKTHLMSI